MGRRIRRLILLVAALAAGCAGTPATPSYGECVQLEAAIAGAQASQRAALESQQGAWKAVIPVAIAARYATSTAALADSEQRLEVLRGEAARRLCALHDPLVN